MAISIFQRKRDLIYLIFFLVHLPVMLGTYRIEKEYRGWRLCYASIAKHIDIMYTTTCVFIYLFLRIFPLAPYLNARM
jgi:hypothetical protein